VNNQPKSKRGGRRPGAGRPRKKLLTAPPSPAEQDAVSYAYAVMRDPDADVKRRDSMARALLSYLRGRKRDDDTKLDDGKWAGILKD
jgi:hypothetical protein